MVKKPAILDTCSEIIDPDLDTLRGRYSTYYFGMDVIINCAGTGPLYTLGRNSIYQAVQVTGDNKIVTGLVNLDILIPRSILTRPSDLGLGKGSLTGIKY
jgi:hypothetical protein